MGRYSRRWAPAVQIIVVVIVFILGFGFLYIIGPLSTQREIAILAAGLGPRVIVVDPGHGGIDGGATGSGGVREEAVVLGVARYLAEYLEQVGARVFLTRDKNVELAEGNVEDLDARLRLAREVAADVFISIHANSFPSPYEFGAQTFYCYNHPESKPLAEKIQNSLVDGIDVLGYNYRQVQEAEYYILRNLDIAAALIEVGFLSNPREESLLSQSAYQKKLAWCIFVGLVRYFSNATRAEEEIGRIDRSYEMTGKMTDGGRSRPGVASRSLVCRLLGYYKKGNHRGKGRSWGVRMGLKAGKRLHQPRGKLF